MSLDTTLTQVLTQPTPDALWNLRADLLILASCLPSGGRDKARWSLEIAGRFHDYISELRSKMTARQYSQFASRLDMGSVGLLAVQDMITEREHLLESLFLGGLSEGLMVLATLQYIKAWESEMALAHNRAVWWLFEGLWRLSQTFRPDMNGGERQKLIDALLAPARSKKMAPAVKMALLVRLFQLLLLGSLAWAGPLTVEGEDR